MHDKIKSIKGKLKNFAISFQKISKEKRIIGVILVLLAGFLLYESLIDVQVKRLKAKGFQFISQKKLLDFYCKLIIDADSLVNAKAETEEKFNQVKKRVVLENGLSDFFAGFRNQVKSFNAQIVALDFKPQESIKSADKASLKYYHRLPFEVSLKGNYYNILQLLQKLEYGDPALHIISIHIKKVFDQDSDVVMELKMEIFVLIDKE